MRRGAVRRGLAVYTVHDDRIVSWRVYWDQMAVMGQLGLLEQ